MENKVLHNEMIIRYNTLSFTHNYIFGFKYKGNIFYTYRTSECLPFVTILDSASRGAGVSLRYKPNKEQKAMLLIDSKVLCSEEYFESLVAETSYNRGEVFEKLLTEMFGQVWVKDNVPFNEGADLTVEGIGYQLKYEKATFTNEKSLARMMAEA